MVIVRPLVTKDAGPRARESTNQRQLPGIWKLPGEPRNPEKASQGRVSVAIARSGSQCARIEVISPSSSTV